MKEKPLIWSSWLSIANIPQTGPVISTFDLDEGGVTIEYPSGGLGFGTSGVRIYYRKMDDTLPVAYFNCCKVVTLRAISFWTVFSGMSIPLCKT